MITKYYNNDRKIETVSLLFVKKMERKKHFKSQLQPRSSLYWSKVNYEKDISGNNWKLKNDLLFQICLGQKVEISIYIIISKVNITQDSTFAKKGTNVNVMYTESSSKYYY